jgi:hypothetical protein
MAKMAESTDQDPLLLLVSVLSRKIKKKLALVRIAHTKAERIRQEDRSLAIDMRTIKSRRAVLQSPVVVADLLQEHPSPFNESRPRVLDDRSPSHTQLDGVELEHERMRLLRHVPRCAFVWYPY